MKANRSHKPGWPGQHYWNQAKGRRGFARSFGRAAVLAVVATRLFAATAVAQTYDVLKAFNGSDGANPWAGLIQGTDGNLYGTTTGGSSGNGTIFKMDTSGSTLTTLHNFTNGDVANSTARLIQAKDGNLYGTAPFGGTGSCSLGCGTVFKIDTNGSTFTTLHNFAGSDGSSPYGGLIQGTDGNLYGTAYLGGTSGKGTIFKIDTNGSTFTTLHNFVNSDGAGPQAGLIQGGDGSLYGTTSFGGAGSKGTIFKIDTNGSALTTLHSFTGSDGSDPEAGGLVQGTDGSLYGTTYGGGASGYGTIFRIGTNGTQFTTLHSFAGSDGRRPNGGVIQGTDLNLYGTTAYGGACAPNPDGCGTVFKIDTNGSALTTLHSFGGSDGSNPFKGLIQATDGNLYGTTVNGGANGGGVVFRLILSGAAQPCVVDTTTLCLSGSRFRVIANWQSPTASGVGTAVGLTPDTGYFWFFNSTNVEMIVKVLDACALNSKKWVFAGGLTNVAVTMTVTDTQTGATRTYTNLQGVAFQPIQDTSAFGTCP